MILEKGRAESTEEVDENTLESRMQRLSELYADRKRLHEEYLEKSKHIREMIKSLEEIVKTETIQRGKTVDSGNIRILYVPQAIIKLKKERNDGE